MTLNDPVYIEAAQALARRMMGEGGTTTEERLDYGFRLCLSRKPNRTEAARLLALFGETHPTYAADSELAKQMATIPIGPVPPGTDVVDLATLTVIGNIILNLDEMLMKR